MLSDEAEAIALGYGLGTVIEDMAISGRGMKGQIWRLVTSRGAFAVKDLLVRQAAADAALDIAYQEAVLAAGTVPLPRPIRSPSGDVLLEVAGHQLRVYEWKDLGSPDSSLDPGLVGRTLAAIHQVHHAPAKPLTGWYVDPVGAPRWAELLADARKAAAPFADDLGAEIPHLLRLEGLLEPPKNLQTCHRDLWADNLLPAVDGVCVIDWESCGLEDPSYEIPMALFEFGAGDRGRTADVYSSYVDAGGPGRVDRYGSFSMVIAQFGHFWETAVATYAAADATDADRQLSSDRVAEAVRTPLRVEHLDEVLDAIGSVAGRATQVSASG
ncbi:MAG TPA: phosphotransferase [Microlunatus sp.]